MSNLCEPNIVPDNCNFINNCGITNNTEVIDTSGTTVTPPGLGIGTIKIPRWLKRVIISGCIKSTVNIPDGFSEIKDIRKKVVVTQSKLICDELIVEGYILKDIKYVRPVNAATDTGRCIAYANSWFDISEKVPFTLCMTVCGLPSNIFPTPNTNQFSEFNFLCDTQSQQCCDRGTMSPSLCETLRIETNYLNERPYTELVGYRIAELDLNNHPCPCPPTAACPPAPCVCLYTSLTEKVKLDIVLDLYVLGLVTVPNTHTFPVPPQSPITGVCEPQCAPPCACQTTPFSCTEVPAPECR